MCSLKLSYELCCVGSVNLRLQVLAEAKISSENSSFGLGENPRGGSLSAPVKNINRSHKVTCLSSSVFAVQSEIICHFSIMDLEHYRTHTPHVLAYTLVISASCNFVHMLLTTFTYVYACKAMHTYT